MAACGDAPGYDDDAASELSFDVMRRRATWDYPIIHWLSRILPDHPALLDAGGHMGSKYLAFEPLLDLGAVEWTVYDLPATVRLARARQAGGDLPAALRFVDRLADAPEADVLLASGLLQYLDMPFERFVADLPARPRFILLNKVAVGRGPTRFTLERIGMSRVPYQIRNRTEFEAEIAAMDYRTLDRWTITALSHSVSTHPWIEASTSCGVVLERKGRM